MTEKTQRVWSKEDKQFLRDNYHRLRPSTIAGRLDRSVDAVLKRASMLDLADGSGTMTRRVHDCEPFVVEDMAFAYHTLGMYEADGSVWTHFDEDDNLLVGFGIFQKDADPYLHRLHSFFDGAGRVVDHHEGVRKYIVTSVEEIGQIILPFFSEFPPRLTKKREQVEQFETTYREQWNLADFDFGQNIRVDDE